MWQLLPFTRGTVEITVSQSVNSHPFSFLWKLQSKNAFTQPAIKCNYFSVEHDLDIQVASARLARKILTSGALADISSGETIPGDEVPDNEQRGSDEDWKSWITNGFSSVHHPIGTASMMRRELGGTPFKSFCCKRTLIRAPGIVDAQLKVYDTSNLRVVDASVLPLQLSAHLSATLYGVAEKAADLIKASH